MNVMIDGYDQGTKQPGNSILGRYVRQRLPKDFLLTLTDLEWLDVCDRFLSGDASNESIVSATYAAADIHPSFHLDPFELLIEASICDVECNPYP